MYCFLYKMSVLEIERDNPMVWTHFSKGKPFIVIHTKKKKRDWSPEQDKKEATVYKRKFCLDTLSFEEAKLRFNSS